MLDVLVFHIIKCVVIEVVVMAIEYNYLIVDSRGSTQSLVLGQGFKTPVYIHTPRWCVVEYPLHWYVAVYISGADI